jgi:hypothetical protein
VGEGKGVRGRVGAGGLSRWRVAAVQARCWELRRELAGQALGAE